MAIYNTGSDAANTMVRAFLTKIGESYLNHSFNTGSGKGKEIWREIKNKFESKCAFCGKEFNELTIEHLINVQSKGMRASSSWECCTFM